MTFLDLRCSLRRIPDFFNEVFQDKEVVLSEEHTEISWADASDSKLLIPAFLDLQKMLDETIQLVHHT